MFEKESEEYADTVKCEWENETYWVDCRDEVEQAFQDGAEFGYNKANEWHYVKDGLPSEDGRYLICNIFSNNYVATNIAEFNSKNGIFGCVDNSTIYAWKEIVLPELPKEIK